MNTKKCHKSRHDENPNLRPIDIGSLKSVKMVTNFGFKLIQQSSIIRVIQNCGQNLFVARNRTELQFFQAHDANINIFVARHRTEFEFPPHLCPSQLITKCVHKHNFSITQNNTTNATGLTWALILARKPSLISNVTSSTHLKNWESLLRKCLRRNSKRCLTTFSLENKPLYLSLNGYALGQSAPQEMANN